MYWDKSYIVQWHEGIRSGINQMWLICEDHSKKWFLVFLSPRSTTNERPNWSEWSVLRLCKPFDCPAIPWTVIQSLWMLCSTLNCPVPQCNACSVHPGLLQPPVYGSPVPPQSAPEEITKAVASLPPEQMFELMKQMQVSGTLPTLWRLVTVCLCKQLPKIFSSKLSAVEFYISK